MIETKIRYVLERGNLKNLYYSCLPKKRFSSIDLLILARTWGDQQIFTAHMYVFISDLKSGIVKLECSKLLQRNNSAYGKI